MVALVQHIIEGNPVINRLLSNSAGSSNTPLYFMLQNCKTRESSRFVNLMADLCLYLDYGRGNYSVFVHIIRRFEKSGY